MLFSKEIEGLHDDGFDGSVNEHQIFEDVFFGNESGTKEHLVTGVVDYKGNFMNQTDQHGLHYLDSHDTNEDSREESSEKQLINGHLEKESDPLASLDRVPVDESQQHFLFPFQGMICHIVESSNQGVVVRSYVQEQHAVDDNGHVLNEMDPSKLRSSYIEGNDWKDIVGKAIASPASQESHATKFRAGIVAKQSGSLRPAKPRWKDHCFVEIDEAEFLTIRDSPNDPRPLLRYHIHRLLRAAGWVIGRRRRNNKYHGVGEYVFKSPEGRPIREFWRAWTWCGQSLFTYADGILPETDCRLWSDLTQFWGDLSSVVMEIEEKLDVLETPSSLARLWCLLDPFAKVVFIDKTLRFLKDGKTVRAKRTVITTSVKKGSLKDIDTAGGHFDEMSLKNQPCNPSLVSASALTSLEGDKWIHKDHGDESSPVRTESQMGEGKYLKGVSYYCPVGRSMCLADTVSESANNCSKLLENGKDFPDLAPLPAYRSESTSERTESCLFEVPISSANALASLGRFDSASGVPQESSSVLKRKAAKKSKRLSEMESIHMYQDEKFDSYYNKSGLAEFSGSNLQINSGRARDHQGLSFGCSESLDYTEQKFKKFRKTLVSSTRLNQLEVNMRGFQSRNFDDGNALPGNTEFRARSKPKIGSKKLKTCRLSDDDLLISAVIKNKTCRFVNKKSSGKTKLLRKRKSQKSSCRLLLRSLNKGGKHIVEAKWPTFAPRTVLSWLIHSGVVTPNEVIQFRNPKDDFIVKTGLITMNGILCKCCDKVQSISEFKSHAGFKLNRPCLNLIMESGKPFTLCQLEAWSDEYKARKAIPQTARAEERDQNDDCCGRCGEGGELICCDNCPATFHQACLFTQELPEGSWYCPQCTCRKCGDVVKYNETLRLPGALKCSQCEHKYHQACSERMVTGSGEVSVTWFCSESCKEIYEGLRSRIGLINLLTDGFSWSVLKCIHGDQKVHSAQRFVAFKAECNSKLAVALTIMEECFLPMVDPRTGIDMIPHVIYSWGSQLARLNYHGFYTVILEKDDISVAVASVRIHGVTVAEMPLIATCSKYRRQGMCRRLLNSIQEMLKSFKVQKLVISAIPGLVETWTSGFGFEPLEDCERQSLSHINLMVFPGTVWLKKPLFPATEADQLSVHPDGTVSSDGSGGTIIEPMQHCTAPSPQDANAGVDVRHPSEFENLQFSEDQGVSDLDGQFPPTSLTETALWCPDNKICDMENFDPGQSSVGNTSHQYSEPGSETRKPESNNLLEIRDVEKHGECSKLSDELPELSHCSPGEVGCRVDTLQIKEEKQFCLDEVSQRIHVLQRYE